MVNTVAVRQRRRRTNNNRRNNGMMVLTRKLTLAKEFNYTTWTNLGSVHLRSANVQLRFTVSDFPGWTGIANNWDQYRVRRAHFRFVHDYTLDQTGVNNAGRTLTLMSAYDPDGGTENPADILSRNNLKITNFNISNSTHTLSCVPGYVTTDGECRKDVWIDQSQTPTFHAYQTVVDTLRLGINPANILNFQCYLTADLEFRGAR